MSSAYRFDIHNYKEFTWKILIRQDITDTEKLIMEHIELWYLVIDDQRN